ncbi:MAG TPA: DUF6748 domain-containing protein [Labilithrix sp.]|nr:DUF6748 domain-containing protein [Labilithrix sp.]
MKLPCAILSLLILAASLAACSVQPSDSDEDFDADADDIVDSSEAALAKTNDNRGFFKVLRRDDRECAAPHCGGYWVKRLNREGKKELCANGKKALECYVSGFDLKGMGMVLEQEAEASAAIRDGKAFIKARVVTNTVGKKKVARLAVDEVWTPQTGSTPEGTVYRARLTDKKRPKSTTAFELNSDERHKVPAPDFENLEVPPSVEALARATEALDTNKGILVAGSVANSKLSVSEYYIRMKPQQFCGGFLSVKCKKVNEYCDFGEFAGCGRADGGGVCRPKPDVCTAEVDPVCGCDRKTYSNACAAAAAGVSVDYPGSCEN